MSDKLHPRAAVIQAAGIALHGERGQTRMAATIGIGKQTLSFIVSGDRAVTDDVDRKVAAGLLKEADRLRKLDDIAGKILHSLEG
jgi:hypothetical protein